MTRSRERAALLRRLRQQRGNVSAMAREEGVSRQVMARRLAAAGIDGVAAEALRRRHHVPGPRALSAPAKERERMLAALARAPNYQAAARRLRISRRTLFRLIDRHGITRDLVSAARAAVPA